MRILNSIIEIITAPFNFLLRTKNNNNAPSRLAKPLFVFFISLLIVALLIIHAYYNVLFK